MRRRAAPQGEPRGAGRRQDHRRGVARSRSPTALAFFDDDRARRRRSSEIARLILKEIRERLGFLGARRPRLPDARPRRARRSPGGEGQRIRLATQIGSSLSGVLYILDEPSIGLHQRDNARLLATLQRLRDLGNTVLVVEHDRDTMLAADHLIDMGPGAGVHGGAVVAAGHAGGGDGERRRRSPGATSPGRSPSRSRRRGARGDGLEPRDPRRARAQPARTSTVEIPLGTITCVTGVSGSGKSSLVDRHALSRARADAQRQPRARRRARRARRAGSCSTRSSTSTRRRSAARRAPTPPPTPGSSRTSASSSRSCPRRARAATTAGRFSFNVKGGRCEACAGDGVIRIEMHFLPDVYVTCEVCGGRRYDRETLEVRYRGKSIADVLDLTVAEALEFLGELPADPAEARRRCTTSASTTSTSASRRPRSPAARRSASSSPASSRAAPPAGRSTSSTSRRPACISRTCAG